MSVQSPIFSSSNKGNSFPLEYTLDQRPLKHESFGTTNQTKKSFFRNPTQIQSSLSISTEESTAIDSSDKLSIRSESDFEVDEQPSLLNNISSLNKKRPASVSPTLCLLQPQTCIEEDLPKFFGKEPITAQAQTTNLRIPKRRNSIYVLDDQCPLTPRSQNLRQKLCLLNSAAISDLFARICLLSSETWFKPSGNFEYLNVQSSQNQEHCVCYIATPNKILLHDKMIGKGRGKNVHLVVNIASRTLEALGEYTASSSSFCRYPSDRLADIKQGLVCEREGPSLLSSLSHPNILFYEPLLVENMPTRFVLMELLSQGNLFHFFSLLQPNLKRKDSQIIFNLFIDGLKAIDFLTEQKLIHGDIKPSNLLIRNHESGPMLVIGDLDSLKHETHYLKYVSQKGRSIAYMSPESATLQTAFVEVGDLEGYAPLKEDLFSLGLSFYVLIVSHFPHGFNHWLESRASLHNNALEQERWRETLKRDLEISLSVWQLSNEEKQHFLNLLISALEPNCQLRPHVKEILEQVLPHYFCFADHEPNSLQYQQSLPLGPF